MKRVLRLCRGGGIAIASFAVVVNVRNGLGETITLHWHGMQLPAIMDGGPHQPIAPGQTCFPPKLGPTAGHPHVS